VLPLLPLLLLLPLVPFAPVDENFSLDRGGIAGVAAAHLWQAQTCAFHGLDSIGRGGIAEVAGVQLFFVSDSKSDYKLQDDFHSLLIGAATTEGDDASDSEDDDASDSEDAAATSKTG